MCGNVLIIFTILIIAGYIYDIKYINININIYYIKKLSLLNKKKYVCGKMRCYVSNNNISFYNAIVYSINDYKKKINKNKNKIYMLFNIEALSRWKETEKIIYGKDRIFDILISHKLLISKHHFSYPYYLNIDKIIKDAKKSISKIEIFMKRKDIVFIYRQSYKYRNRLCEMFNERIKVDKYGLAYKNHLKWPDNLPNDKHLLIRNYKFCLAIENTINQVKWGQMHSDSIDDDYVTEKLWDCMRGGSIPIYFGAKNIKIFYPTNFSIISASDFKNYSDLIEYVYSIKNKKEILKKYIKWPYRYSKDWYNLMQKYSVSSCKLCNYIKEYHL